jgi:hypothetical protein
MFPRQNIDPKDKAEGYLLEYILVDGKTNRTQVFKNDKFSKANFSDLYLTFLEDNTIKTIKTLRVMPDGNEKVYNFNKIHSAFLRMLIETIGEGETKKFFQDRLIVLAQNESKQFRELVSILPLELEDTHLLPPDEIILDRAESNRSQSIRKIEEKKKNMTEESKQRILEAGGSVKTKYAIDANAIAREVRGK